MKISKNILRGALCTAIFGIITGEVNGTDATPTAITPPAPVDPFGGAIVNFDNVSDASLPDDLQAQKHVDKNIGPCFVFRIQLKPKQSAWIWFRAHAQQPTTEDTIRYSLANIDNREESPITEWYMKMFGVVPFDQGGKYVQLGWEQPSENPDSLEEPHQVPIIRFAFHEAIIDMLTNEFLSYIKSIDSLEEKSKKYQAEHPTYATGYEQDYRDCQEEIAKYRNDIITFLGLDPKDFTGQYDHKENIKAALCKLNKTNLESFIELLAGNPANELLHLTSPVVTNEVDVFQRKIEEALDIFIRLLGDDNEITINDLLARNSLLPLPKKFQQTFQKIASTQVGRVLLYRILIEIIRKSSPTSNIGQVDSDAHYSLKNTFAKKLREYNRAIKVDFGVHSFVQGGYYNKIGMILFDVNNIEKLLIGENQGIASTVEKTIENDEGFESTLFHSLLHWYQYLRAPDRSGCLSDFFLKFYLGNIAQQNKDETRSMWYSDSWKELTAIAGFPRTHVKCIYYDENKNVINYFLDGDDLSENLYRASIGLPLVCGPVCDPWEGGKNVTKIDETVVKALTKTIDCNILPFTRIYGSYRVQK